MRYVFNYVFFKHLLNKNNYKSMEFDLIYPNYNKQKERQKRNKQKNLVNNDGSLAVFAWFSVRCRKKHIYT